jgi:hypothetical protein
VTKVHKKYVNHGMSNQKKKKNKSFLFPWYSSREIEKTIKSYHNFLEIVLELISNRHIDI